MIKIGVVSWGLPGGGVYAPEIAQMAGLDGIQLELGSYQDGFPLSQAVIQENLLKDQETYNLEFPSIVLNDVMLHPYINGRDTEDGKIAYDQIELGVNVAAKMKINVVMIPNFESNIISLPQHVIETEKALTFACDCALSHGITIATETSLQNDLHLELVKRINKPNLKIFFDSMNYKYFSKLSQLEELTALFPHLLNQMHVKDGIDAPGGSLLGKGNMDIADQLKFLASMDFEGWLILENYYNKLPLRSENAENQIELLKSDVAFVNQIFGI